jgi:hypothetical protein
VILVGAMVACGESLRYPQRKDIPRWWQETRAFYCPLANSGAGSSLMKYKTEYLPDDFKTFRDMDLILDDAQRLGTNVIYLVDYWEPDYEHKSDYRPKLKWGGDKAFREGIEKVHRRGGKVICYLEALIITRETELGRGEGLEWAMLDDKGNPYPYYGRPRFLLMYPGEGSGWVDYIVGVAGRLARDFKIDGIHLDSYGVHLDHVLPDHNPRHLHGKDTESFHKGALELVTRMRAEIRKYVPDAVLILEGAERTDMLDACDGAQFECLEKLRKKPWFGQKKYPMFTSGFAIEEMQEILDTGQNLALSPWWFKAHPGGRDEKRLKEKTDKSNRFDQIMALHRYHNLLYANDLVPDPPADFDALFDGIIEALNKKGWGSEFRYPPLARTASKYMAAYRRHEDQLKREPADVIREMLEQASRRSLRADTGSPKAK